MVQEISANNRILLLVWPLKDLHRPKQYLLKNSVGGARFSEEPSAQGLKGCQDHITLSLLTVTYYSVVTKGPVLRWEMWRG